MLPIKKWPKRDNRVSRKDLRERLDRHSRQPFADLLSTLLQCRPDPVSLLAFATAHPDKWATAIGVIARLAGYHEKLVVEESLTININNMSDAELHQKLLEHRLKIGLTDITPQENVTAKQIEHQTDNKKPSQVSPGGLLIED